jgi:curved DNA-binding protein CbpA
VDVRSLPLTPIEGFVLSRIDGSATTDEISDLTSLAAEDVRRILTKLIDLGAVEWADQSVEVPRRSWLPPPSEPTPRRAVPAPTISEPPPQAPEPKALDNQPAEAPLPDSPSAAAEDVPSDGIELSPERRRRIDELYPILELLDHYQVLGLAPDVELSQIRATYFELSKVFHPDTAFRKNLGPYKAKMEAIFKRITEAYEVLGKKKSRAEYDAYLALQGATRRVEHVIELSTPREGAVAAASAEPAPGGPAPVAPAAPSSRDESPAPPSAAAPPPDERASSAPGVRSEESKRRARELALRRLSRLRALTPPASPAAPRPRGEVARDLVRSLQATAALTGGRDPVQRHLLEARRHEQNGDIAGAVRELQAASELDPTREEVRAELGRLSGALARELADNYRRQAEYEERHRKWTAAANSWMKVVKHMPDDVEAAIRGALALVEAKGDLHQARRLAQQACEMRPHDVQARLALGRVYLAAGLPLNARRELEHAAMLDPGNEIVKNLLREFKS